MSASAVRLHRVCFFSLLAVFQLAVAAPTINIVPGNAVDPGASHQALSGRPTTLKAAVDAGCAGVCTWRWIPGDGGSAVIGNVDADPTDPTQLDDVGYNPYWAVWAEHTYVGNPGDVFIALLTVTDGTSATT